jgi:hypothetical protein
MLCSAMFSSNTVPDRVSNPDWIQSGQLIRIRNPDPDSRGKNSCVKWWMFSFDGGNICLGGLGISK